MVHRRLTERRETSVETRRAGVGRGGSRGKRLRSRAVRRVAGGATANIMRQHWRRRRRHPPGQAARQGSRGVLVLLVRRGLVPLRLRVLCMGILIRRPSRRGRDAVKLARRLGGARRANAFRRVTIVPPRPSRRMPLRRVILPARSGRSANETRRAESHLLRGSFLTRILRPWSANDLDRSVALCMRGTSWQSRQRTPRVHRRAVEDLTPA